MTGQPLLEPRPAPAQQFERYANNRSRQITASSSIGCGRCAACAPTVQPVSSSPDTPSCETFDAAFTNLPVVTIDDLVRLVPPPAAPVDADGDWSAVEAALGLRLPADFQALVGRYGVGQFGDISLWTPFAKRLDGVFDLVKHARRLVDFHRPLRDELPEDFPHPLYPEPGGLLEWASTSNGDSRCWLTGGDPDSWPAVVWNIRRGAYTVMSNNP